MMMMMMNNNELHPVEMLLIAGLAVVEAVVVLAVALLGLVMAVAQWKPAAVEHSAPTPLPAMPLEPAAPAVEPAAPLPPAVPLLAAVAGDAADHLAPLNVTQLRRLARAAGLPPSLTRNGRRDALLLALAGLEVALV